VDLSFSPDDAAFREEVCASIRGRYPAEMRVKQIGEAARLIGQQAVQIHGGMGMSDALDAGRYFKRLTAIARQFGTPDHHLGRYLQVA
jgi:alkylation response protein AidB-like acyl-CoA dehydrogenase